MKTLFLDLSPAYIPFVVQCTKAAGDKVNPTVDNLIIYEEGGADATFDSGTVTGSPFDPVQINSKTGLWGVLVAKSVLTVGKFYIALWEMTVDGVPTAMVERFFACNASQFKATGFAVAGDAMDLVAGLKTGSYVNSQVKAQDNIDFGELQKASLDAATPIVTVSDKTGFSISGTKTTLDALNDISTTELAARFDEIKGAGWTDETLKMIKELIGSGAQTVLIYPLEVIGVKDGYGDIRDPIKFIKGESKIKWYQLKSETTGEILDITNYTFKLAVKSNYRDVVYLIDPFIAEKDIPNKKFGFVFNAAKTANVAKGVFEIAMYDNSNPSQKTVLTPAGGVQFGIYEDIIDT